MPGNGRKVSLYLSEKGGTVTAIEGDHDFCYFYGSLLEAIRTGNPK